MLKWDKSFPGAGAFEAGDAAAEAELCALLNRTTQKMQRTIGFKPILLAHDHCYAKQGLIVQVGPYFWSERCGAMSERAPDQVKRAYEYLQDLEEAHWGDLAGRAAPRARQSHARTIFISGTERPPPPAPPKQPGAYAALSVQENDVLCAFNVSHFLQIPIAFAIEPKRLSMLGMHSYVNGARMLPITPHGASRPMDLRWAYDTRLDKAKIAEFSYLVADAVGSLRAFGAEPTVVASCPRRFNDAGSDPEWRAVQVGEFSWSNSSYFNDTAAMLKAGPLQAREAAKLLDNLERLDWRESYRSGFGREITYGEASAIICQDERAFFVAIETNGGGGPVYEINADGSLTLIGDGERIDWKIGEPRVLDWVPFDT